MEFCLISFCRLSGQHFPAVPEFLQPIISSTHQSETPDSSFSSCVCLPNLAFSSWRRRIFKLEEINYIHTQRYLFICAWNGIIYTWSRCGRFHSDSSAHTGRVGNVPGMETLRLEKPPRTPRHVQVLFPAPVSLKTCWNFTMDASGSNLEKPLDPQGQEVVPW